VIPAAISVMNLKILIIFSLIALLLKWFGVITLCFHQQVRPSFYDQYWAWIPNALPGEEKIYMVGLAVVCWAIWKCRNRACFQKKIH
jgi:hypothetical protein